MNLSSRHPLLNGIFWLGTEFCLAAAIFSAGCTNVPRQAEARAAVGEGTSTGADPKVNQSFYKPDLQVWSTRFEGESRELYRKRAEIIAASGAKSGMTVADVGAGTGLFTMLLGKQVLPNGKVIATEISQSFAEAILQRANQEKLPNISSVISTHTETKLPENSVDLVFTADTYHHFEQVTPILNSIRKALRPGGWLIVVDFERIPGVTAKQTFDHVRAGKETVIQEITSTGFRLREEVKTLGLKDNYYLVFERT
jgi:predicted methyltransferase